MSDLGRTTRCYVSAFQRDRVHAASLNKGEKRFLVADFNGAIPVEDSITSVTWRCYQGFPILMSNPVINGRETSVLINAQCSGIGMLKCDATMNTGEVLTQRFTIEVRNRWWGWYDNQGPFLTGPTSLTVSI